MSHITAINPFEVPAGREAEALQIWDRLNDFMGQQPGFVSAKLYKSMDPASRFGLVTVAQWESPDHFVRMLSSDELKSAAAGLESFPHFPGLYEVVRGA